MKAALARLKKQQEENKDIPHTSEATDSSTSSTEVAIGTECKHGGCQTVSIYNYYYIIINYCIRLILDQILIYLIVSIILVYLYFMKG